MAFANDLRTGPSHGPAIGGRRWPHHRFDNATTAHLLLSWSLQCVNPIGQILQPTLRVYVQPVEDEHGVFIRML